MHSKRAQDSSKAQETEFLHDSSVTDGPDVRTSDRQHGRIVRYFQGRPKRYFVGLFAVVLAVIILVCPSAYVMEMPGPTENVLGKDGDTEIIQVTGVKTYDDPGQLRLVTVNASGVPGYPVTNAQILYAWLNKEMMVLPREAVFDTTQTAEQYEAQSSKQMSDSQDSAITAGLDFAKSLGIDVSDAKVTMHVDDIGGPSAGMMYALGLVDMLTPAEETGGLTIAGTGTIDDDGNVGSIGGIALKMIGAKRDGATWFLAPAANCSSVVGNVPDGLNVVKVSTLSEAYAALVKIGEGEGSTLATCSAS
ncbi:Lon protease [Bifidobacterium sp. BRDM6]|uniref:endopeptidase La n=2 Tax=Bifidobacterium choloepi TaxID=2614131 RepID=A0A6I5N343_9BIFI|nr:Lon protease [Bifidobacterium choloepi]